MIIFTRFLLFENLEGLHNLFRVTAKDSPEITFTDDLQIHTLELENTKFPQLPAINKPLRGWLEFFYFADKKSEEEMNALLETNNDPAVSQAHDAYLRFNQNAELRHLNDMREMALHDYTTEMNFSRAEGEAIGEARGEARGKAEGEAKAVLRTLTKRFRVVPETIRERILTITDLNRLEYLADFAFECESLEEFAESVK